MLSSDDPVRVFQDFATIDLLLGTEVVPMAREALTAADAA